MTANPIWIAAYGGPPPAVVGASAVWIAPGDGTVLSAVASYIAGYFNPVAGASPVWIAGYGGPPPAAIGATPITIVGYGGFGGAAPTNSPQALAYLARTVGGNEGGNGANIATLIDGLVSDGVWAKLDALYVLAQQNETDARLNLVGTSYGLTGSGILADPLVITFTPYVGFSGFAGVGLSTGFIPSSAPSPHFTLASASVGGWMYNVSNANTLMVGTADNVTGVYPTYGGATFYAFLNSKFAAPTSPAAVGFYAVDGAATINAYYNGSSLASAAYGATVLDTVQVSIGKTNAGAWGGTISAAFIGASLGAAGQLALYNRLRTYMSSVGVP